MLWSEKYMRDFVEDACAKPPEEMAAMLPAAPGDAFLRAALKEVVRRAKDSPIVTAKMLPLLVGRCRPRPVLNMMKEIIERRPVRTRGECLPVVYALGRFRPIRADAYALGNKHLSACAYAHLSAITDANDASWPENRERARRAGALLDAARALGFPPAGTSAALRNRERMGELLQRHYDSEVREVVARFAGGLWRDFEYELTEAADRYGEYASGEAAEEALREIALHRALAAPPEESLHLLHGDDAPLSQKAALLGRLRGRMRPAYAGDVEPYAAHAEPIVAITAVCLMSEVAPAHRICRMLVELLRRPPETPTTAFALSLLYDMRDVWLSSTVPEALRELLEEHRLHRSGNWPVRAAAARVMGMCGLRDKLLRLLQGDTCYLVRRAAYTGLGGAPEGGVAAPAPRRGDDDISEHYSPYLRRKRWWQEEER